MTIFEALLIGITCVCLLLLIFFSVIVLMSFPRKYEVDKSIKDAFVKYVLAQFIISTLALVMHAALNRPESLGTLSAKVLHNQWDWEWLKGGWQSNWSIEETDSANFSMIGETILYRDSDGNSGKKFLDWKSESLKLSADGKSLRGEVRLTALDRGFKVASAPNAGSYKAAVSLEPMICMKGTWILKKQLKNNEWVDFDGHVEQEGGITLCQH